MSGSRFAVLFAAVGLCILSTHCKPSAPRPTGSIVSQVDHILIASSQAKELFALLSETLQFPVAWPMADYGNFASGGVAVGNVNLEIIKDSDVTGPRWTGFALEPEPLKIALPELKARGIRYGWPAPFRSKQPDGSTTTRWTTVALPDVSGDVIQVFFCEYGHDVPARRRSLIEQLQSRGGGPLSIHSVKEIVYGAVDAKRTQEQWQKLLNPIPVSPPGVWTIGAGPAIRVMSSDRNQILGLVINVKSLDQARRFLKENNLLGTEQPAAITLAGPHLQGLNITLVEGP